MNFNKNEFGYRSACAKHKDEGALAHTRTEFGGGPPVIRLGRRPAGPNPTRGTRAVVVLRTTLRLARNRVLTPPFGGCFINYVIVRRQRSTRSGYDLRARPNGWPKVARGGGWRSGPYRREQPVRTRTTFGPALAPVRAGCRSLRDHPHSGRAGRARARPNGV